MKAHGVPSILVTRQRCIVKELITKADLAAIHDHLQKAIDYRFLEVLVEPASFSKMALYEDVMKRYPDRTVTLFDDSEDERQIAASHGIRVFDGTNLYQAVCRAFKIVP